MEGKHQLNLFWGGVKNGGGAGEVKKKKSKRGDKTLKDWETRAAGLKEKKKTPSPIQVQTFIRKLPKTERSVP